MRGRWVISGSVHTKLGCLTEKEARKIGRSLMSALKQSRTAVAGLYRRKMQVTKSEERRHTQENEELLEALAKSTPSGGQVSLIFTSKVSRPVDV